MNKPDHLWINRIIYMWLWYSYVKSKKKWDETFIHCYGKLIIFCVHIQRTICKNKYLNFIINIECVCLWTLSYTPSIKLSIEFNKLYTNSLKTFKQPKIFNCDTSIMWTNPHSHSMLKQHAVPCNHIIKISFQNMKVCQNLHVTYINLID